ncbi:MAG: efflux RND transporter periplasmic adaptor subunit [Treponema sp.]|nr:efflux RND transporter periplasmic adaptor subunit [Treponema sp.]
MILYKKTIILLAAALLFLSCKKKNEREKEPELVQTIEARLVDKCETLESYGMIMYKKKNEVTSMVEGVIVENYIQEGSQVKKGMPLLKMKNVQYEIKRTECINVLNSAKTRVRAAKNNLIENEKSLKGKIMKIENLKAQASIKKAQADLMEKDFEKNEKLFLAGGISESDRERLLMETQKAREELKILEKEIAIEELGLKESDLIAAGIIPSSQKEELEKQIIDFNLQSAKIQIELAQTEEENAIQNLRSIESLIENLTILSPMDGIVGQLNCECGESVVQNQKLLTVIEMDEPYAEISLQEKDCQKIQIGSPALVSINSMKEEQESRVSFISPLADYESGNFKVKIPLKNEKQKIRLGMFVQCSIKTNDSQKIFQLPKEAALKIQGNQAIFFGVKNGYLYEKNCPIASESESFIFIKSGIEEGETIVLKANAALKEGLYVKCI